MDNSVIAKSGWLLRRGTDGKWEKNWVELYRDGYLKYYESDCSPNAEDIIFMPTDCLAIKTGLQVDPTVQPPEGHRRQCLFSISAMSNKTWIFCGDSLDDMRAWQLALEQARLLVINPPYANSQLMSAQRAAMPLDCSNPANPFWSCLFPCPPPSPYIPGFSADPITYLPSRLPALYPAPFYPLPPSFYAPDAQHLVPPLNYPYPPPSAAPLPQAGLRQTHPDTPQSHRFHDTTLGYLPFNR